jgi:hypothetical protein
MKQFDQYLNKLKLPTKQLTWKEDCEQLVSWGYTPCGNCIHWRRSFATRDAHLTARGECDDPRYDSSRERSYRDTCLFGYQSISLTLKELETLRDEIAL